MQQLIQLLLRHVKPRIRLLPLCIAVFFSCREHQQAQQSRVVEPAFYYWKSVLNISAFELQQLDTLHVNTLYIKFFDVDWNNTTRQPSPVAKLQSAGFKLPKKFSVIPTVFITNECIKKIDSGQIQTLAANIFNLVEDISKTNGFTPVKEIQFDCDWTATTRNNYFFLLEQLTERWKNTSITLSATIRLHQVKFMGKTGVPPVKKGLLMCYNMGNLKNPATVNSIIETAELEKYTSGLHGYPLPLDVAFPLFSWKVLFRQNVYSGLIESLPDSMLSNDIAGRLDNRYTFLKDTLLNGYTFKKGDVLRSEESSYKEILLTAQSISRGLKNTSPRVCLYHLDSVILKKYSPHELETVYNSLR